jgi:hypothetical protein
MLWDDIMTTHTITRQLASFIFLACALTCVTYAAAPTQVFVNGVALQTEQINFLRSSGSGLT